jgi:hypothetical protein
MDQILAAVMTKSSREFLKSVTASESFRKNGNDHFAKNRSKKALEAYNFALIEAPPQSKSLVLSYSNRSAVFYSQSRYHNCLYDINRVKAELPAVASQSSETSDLSDIHNLVFKLLNREINCFIKLNRRSFDFDNNQLLAVLKSDKFQHMAEQTEQKLLKTREVFTNYANSLPDQAKELVDEAVANVKTLVVEANLISDLVDIQFSEAKGRFCTAAKKINKGDCVFVEKPYAAILLPEFTHTYCYACFKELCDYDETNTSFFLDTNNTECCDRCSEVYYCSQECKQLATKSVNARESYHKFECGIIQSLLHNLGIAHLAYRILAATPADMILEVI